MIINDLLFEFIFKIINKFTYFILTKFITNIVKDCKLGKYKTFYLTNYLKIIYYYIPSILLDRRRMADNFIQIQYQKIIHNIFFDSIKLVTDI